MTEVLELDYEADPTEEGEEDLHNSPVNLQQAVVAGTDWTTETLLNQVRRGNIDLNPIFQRRDAWTLERKSRFIESLILGLPVPQLVLAERRDKRGSYIVIDGKQRILSLAQFAGQGESSASGFRLRGLTTRSDLNGNTYEQLVSNPEHNDDLTALENSTIRTVVIRGWPDEDFLYLIFLRLNTGSVPLSPQELRQALHPGPFVDYVDKFSYDNAQIRRVLGLSRPDFRMRDVELAVRYYGFVNFLDDYAGDLKRFLDLTCMRLNERWTGVEARIREQGEQLNQAIDATYVVFGDDAFKRYLGAHRYERRFNRAVFDLMVYFMRDPRIAQAAVESREEVRAAYERLGVENSEFSSATQATTKSLSATFARLQSWAEALNAVLPVEVPQLRLDSGRIRELP